MREKMIFSKGFIFRWGQRIEDFGASIGHIKVFRIYIFPRLASPIKNTGLKIKDFVLKHSVETF
jgi:hypothetical protein